MQHNDFAEQLSGAGVTTAEILYHLPETPALLQSFVWQFNDLAPRFPRLIRFLDFWVDSIDGTLAEVRVAHKSLIGPTEMRLIDNEWRLH